jgi:hypothetical protein
LNFLSWPKADFSRFLNYYKFCFFSLPLLV